MIFVYLAAVVFVLFTSSIQKYLEVAFNTYTWPNMIIWVVLNYSIKGVFLALVIFLTRNYFIHTLSIFNTIITHFFLSIVFIFFSYSLLLSFEKLFLSQAIELSLNNILMRSLYGANFSFFMYFAIISILYAALYVNRQQQEVIGAERLKNQLLDARMNNLRMQIQPHFLFNTLNGIAYLTGTNVQKSKDAISDLSELLRYTLRIKTNNFVQFIEEINYSKKYLSLMKLRFEDKLTFTIDIEDENKNLKFPPFILQPILENAIQYGFSEDHKTIHISIQSRTTSNQLIIGIFNNGKSLPKTVLYGTGLGNIVRRLNELFGEDFDFTMDNNNDLVQTKIVVPKMEKF